MTECEVIAEALKRLELEDYGTARCNECIKSFLQALNKVIDAKLTR